MSESDYLLSYGRAGDFARFGSPEPLACRRGDKLVVRTHRGQELGVVLRPATNGHAHFLSDKFVGQILRRATPGDEELAARMEKRGQMLFQDSRALTATLNLPLEILDAEVLLDGRQAVLHYLHWVECDPRPLMDPLAERYHLLVTMHDLSLPEAEPEQHDDHGCGAGACGSSGCGSCKGGHCSTCSSRKSPESKLESPDSITPVFAGGDRSGGKEARRVYPDRIPLLSTSDV